MTFYTPEDALNYLKRQVSSLFAARGILQELYGRAVVARQKSMGTTQATQATQLVQDLAQSISDQSALESRVRSLVPSSWLPQDLGLFPVIIGVGAIGVAGAVYLHLQRTSQHRDTLALVEKGILTPAQAIKLEQSSGLIGSGGFSGITDNLSTIVMFAVGGYALYLFGPLLSKLVGGRK